MAADGKEHCATCCSIMSAIAVPLLAYFGLLCFNDSPMIEIPEDSKPSAAWSCWLAAVMYAVTFFMAYSYKMTRARQVKPRSPESEMTNLRNRQ